MRFENSPEPGRPASDARRIVERGAVGHSFAKRTLGRPVRVARPRPNPYTRAVNLPPAPAVTGAAIVDAVRVSRKATSGDSLPETVAPGPLAPPCFLWESPEGEAIFMTGAAARLECRGPKPWDEARAWLRTLADLTAEYLEGSNPPPLAFAGFSFDGLPAGEWGFPAGVVLLPAMEWRRDANGRGIMTTWRLAEPERDGVRAFREVPVDGGPRGASDSDSGTDWSPAGWSLAVGSALAEIRSGRVEKVVLARSRAARMARPFDAAVAFAALRAAHPTCFRFLYWDERGGVFLGASPERLVSLRDRTVLADAVAGTGPVEAGSDAGAAYALLNNRKERREHEVVVRELLAKIGSVCDDVATAEAPAIQRLRHVVHLRSTVTGRAPAGTHVLELVSRLHPTPAVAGSPAGAALDLIRSLEPRSRGWFAGPIGWVDASGDGDFAVGIRSALVRGDQALLYAGAGIVEGSDPEREWNECETKMRFVEDVLLHG